MDYGSTNHAGFRDRADDFTLDLLTAVLRGDLEGARAVHRMVLPMPGHAPGSTLHTPVLKTP